MADKKDSLAISANDVGKYLASLRAEYKGIEGTINLLEAIKDAKKICERLEASKVKLTKETERYQELADAALQDADNAEAEGVKRTNEAHIRAEASIGKINKRGEALAKKLSEKEKEVNDSISGLERSVVAKEQQASEREEKANTKAAAAVNKQAQAEDALKKIYELAGGVK